MTDRRVNLIVTWINNGVLLLVGVFSVLYSILFRNFAELHIQLAFLNFPIFIGEVLLGFCCLLAIIKFRLKQEKLTRWHWLIGGYMIWLLIKALHGYFTWGPLALRHSALFYYPLFAILGYYFSKERSYGSILKVILLLSMIVIFSFLDSIRYFLFTYLMLYGCLIFGLRSKKLMAGFIVIGFFVFPFDVLFGGGRSHFIAIIAAFMFLAACVVFALLQGRKKVQVLTLCCFVVFIVGGTSLFGYKNKLKSMIALDGLAQEYRENQVIIKKRRKTFEFSKLKPRLYNPDQGNTYTLIKNQPENFLGDNVKDELAGALEVIVGEGGDADESVKSDGGIENSRKYVDQIIEKHASVVTDHETHEQVIQQASRKDFELQVNQIVSDKMVWIQAELEKSFLKEVKDGIKRTGTARAEIVVERAQERAQEILTRATNDMRDEIRSIYKSIMGDGQVERDSYLDNLFLTVKERFSAVVREYMKYVGKQIEMTKGKRGVKQEQNNIFFRLYIWQDMFDDLFQEKAIFGINMGRPLRSKRIEMLRMAWGEWNRDGWITSHNSFIHLIYRSGVLGVFFLFGLFYGFITVLKKLIVRKSLPGILIISSFFYWLVLANFLVVFEFPYYSIPVWSLVGLTTAYFYRKV